MLEYRYSFDLYKFCIRNYGINVGRFPIFVRFIALSYTSTRQNPAKYLHSVFDICDRGEYRFELFIHANVRVYKKKELTPRFPIRLSS